MKQVNFAVYNTSTGVIRQFYEAPEEQLNAQVQDGEAAYIDCPYGATHIVNGAPTTVPINASVVEDDVLRIIRDTLLAKCDWTQMPDAPLSDAKRQEWAIYRQQLRDLPATYSADNVVWPTPPN